MDVASFKYSCLGELNVKLSWLLIISYIHIWFQILAVVSVCVGIYFYTHHEYIVFVTYNHLLGLCLLTATGCLVLVIGFIGAIAVIRESVLLLHFVSVTSNIAHFTCIMYNCCFIVLVCLFIVILHCIVSFWRSVGIGSWQERSMNNYRNNFSNQYKINRCVHLTEVRVYWLGSRRPLQHTGWCNEGIQQFLRL